MCAYGACRGAGQRLGPSNPRVEFVVESKRRQRHGLPDPHNEVHASQWDKRAPRGINEPAYWQDDDATAPTAGPNAKLVQQQPSWQAVLPDSRHYRHHLQAA